MIKFKQKSTMRNFFIFLAMSLSLQAMAQNTFFNIYNTHQIETTFDANFWPPKNPELIIYYSMSFS